MIVTCPVAVIEVNLPVLGVPAPTVAPSTVPPLISGELITGVFSVLLFSDNVLPAVVAGF